MSSTASFNDVSPEAAALKREDAKEQDLLWIRQRDAKEGLFPVKCVTLPRAIKPCHSQWVADSWMAISSWSQISLGTWSFISWPSAGGECKSWGTDSDKEPCR
jgi:hypothetical protein